MLVQYLAELREPLPDESYRLCPVEDGQTVAQIGLGRLSLLEQPENHTRSNIGSTEEKIILAMIGTKSYPTLLWLEIYGASI